MEREARASNSLYATRHLALASLTSTIGAFNPRSKLDDIRASRTRLGPRRVAEETRRLAGSLAP